MEVQTILDPEHLADGQLSHQNPEAEICTLYEAESISMSVRFPRGVHSLLQMLLFAGTTNISHYPLDYLVDYASPTTGPVSLPLYNLP